MRPRDAELLRRAATILRHFGAADDNLLRSPLWEPFYSHFSLAGRPPPPTVSVSKFANASSKRALYTIINNSTGTANATLWLEIAHTADSAAEGAPFRYYDVYHGLALQVHSTRACGKGLACDYVSLQVEPSAVGAVLSTRDALSPADEALLQQMRQMTALPLAAYPAEWAGPLPQHLADDTSRVASPRGKRMVEASPQQAVVGGMDGASAAAAAAAAAAASRLVALRADESFTFRVMGSEIEDGCCGDAYKGGYYDKLGVDVMYPWEKAPRRQHSHTFDAGEPAVAPFRIDATQVTNEAYAKFDRSGYRPPSTQNYLRHWVGQGARRHPAPNTAQQPVRWVGIEDARAYCAWRGARLPSEIEWALAAQGPDHVRGVAARSYPWGDAPPNASFVPTPQVRPPFTPERVGQRPAGASPFGALDMAGLVWEWTSEFVDERTRAAVLRGGSSFQPFALDQFGDNWYFPGGAPYDAKRAFIPFGSEYPGWGADKYPAAYSTGSHGKLLLMAPSYDRSGAVGFRCVSNANL